MCVCVIALFVMVMIVYMAYDFYCYVCLFVHVFIVLCAYGVVVCFYDLLFVELSMFGFSFSMC